MVGSVLFLLGCWIGCIVGFFITGLISSNRSSTESSDEMSLAFRQSAERGVFLSAGLNFVEEAHPSSMSSTISPPLS